MIRSLVVLVGALAFSPYHSVADARLQPPHTARSCKFSRHVKTIESLGSRPDLKDSLDRQGIAMADRGQPYERTDVKSKESLGRMFLVALSSGDDVVVWYTQGGLVSSDHAVLLRMATGAVGNQYLVQGGTNFHGPFCMVSKAILGGVRSHGERY